MDVSGSKEPLDVVNAGSEEVGSTVDDRLMYRRKFSIGGWWVTPTDHNCIIFYNMQPHPTRMAGQGGEGWALGTRGSINHLTP